MADIHTVFEAITELGTSGGKIKVGVADKNEYETIRTRLVKLWNKHKELLISIGGEDSDPLLAFSLCADFHADTEQPYAHFYLGKPRRKLAKSYSFSIVDETGSVVAADAANEPIPPTPDTRSAS